MECSFCSEINNKKNNNFYDMYLKYDFENAGLNNRFLAITNSFIIMPMIGPLVPGYLLVVPKKHYLSMSQLSKEELEELKLIKKELKLIFNDVYGNCIFYEHGAVSCTLKGGSCSDHAHLHVVAVNVDVKDKFFNYGYYLRKINNYEDILNQSIRNVPYLYYENQKNEMYVVDAPIVESQFIRKLIAKEIRAFDRVLWYENIRTDWMIDIIKKLRPYFKERGDLFI